MELTLPGTDVALDEQGYLTNPEQWSEEVAMHIAAEEGITLTEKHFEVLTYLRKEALAGTKLSIRRIGKSGIVTVKEFYDLFPGGPLKKSSRIAGIAKPASCV